MINVGKGGLVSDHVGPLAEAGAHPLQALMSLHVIFSTSHARGQAAMAAARRSTDAEASVSTGLSTEVGRRVASPSLGPRRPTSTTSRRRADQLHVDGPPRPSSLHQLDRHDAGPVARAGPRARRHVSRHPLRRARPRVFIGARRQLHHRAARTRRARRSSTPRARARRTSAASRSAASPRCGSACTRPTASRASCWPTPRRASARVQIVDRAHRARAASRAWRRVAELAMPRWFSPDFRHASRTTVEQFKAMVEACPADGISGMLRGAAGRGSAGGDRRRSAARCWPSPAATDVPTPPEALRVHPRAHRRLEDADARRRPSEQRRAGRGVHVCRDGIPGEPLNR